MIPGLRISALVLLVALLSFATGAAAHSGHKHQEPAPVATMDAPARATPELPRSPLDSLSAPCPGNLPVGCCCRAPSVLPSQGHTALPAGPGFRLFLASLEQYRSRPPAPVFSARLEAPRPRSPPLHS